MKSFTAAGKSTHRSLRLISSRFGASSKSRRTAALKEKHWENLHLTETSESVSESHRVVISDWDSVSRSVCLGSLKINVGDFEKKKKTKRTQSVKWGTDPTLHSSVIDGSSGVSHAAWRQKYSLKERRETHTKDERRGQLTGIISLYCCACCQCSKWLDPGKSSCLRVEFSGVQLSCALYQL